MLGTTSFLVSENGTSDSPRLSPRFRPPAPRGPGGGSEWWSRPPR